MAKVHNCFFYQSKEMPWKTPSNCEVLSYAIQTEGSDGSGEGGEEVDGAEEASDEGKSESASKGA